MAEGGLIPPVIIELKGRATELKAALAETKTELSEVAEHSEATSSRMGGAMTKAAGYGKTLAIGIGGAAVAVGGFAVEAATSAQVVDAKLSTAIKDAGGSMEELEPKIDATDSRLRKFGFTNDDTNTALASLTTALKDPEKAMKAMSVAADLAKAKNIDLNTAAQLVAKGMEGQTRPLKQLGIDLPTYTGGAQNAKVAQESLATAQLTLNHVLEKYPDAANKASKGHQAYETAALAVAQAQDRVNSTANAGTTIMDAISSRVKGAASAYGDTLKGKVDSAKAGLENMAEVLGKKLIPIISDAISWAQKFVGWLGDHTPVLYTLAAVIGTVVVLAITAYIAKLVVAGAQSVVQFAKMIASGAKWAAEQSVQLAKSAAGFVVWLAEHAVMAAGFIAQNIAMAASATAAFIAENAATLGIVAGIALLVAGIVWLATHWSQAWGAIKTAVSAVWDFLKTVFNWVKSILIDAVSAYLHIYVALWEAVWGGIQAAVGAVWGFLQAVWGWISAIFGGAAHAVLSGLGSVFSSVWGGIRSVVSGVWGFLQAVWGGIEGGARAVWGVIQSLGGVFSSVFGAIRSAVQGAWNIIKGIFDAISRAVGGVIHAIGSVVSTVSKVGGAIGHFLGFDNGGLVPGPKGKPRLAVVHGGEYVLSNDMLAGRQEPTDLLDAKSANGYTAASPTQQALTGGTQPSRGNTVIVNAQTNADPHRIAAEAGWALRAMA